MLEVYPLEWTLEKPLVIPTFLYSLYEQMDTSTPLGAHFKEMVKTNSKLDVTITLCLS